MKEIQNAETVVPVDTPPVIGSIHSIPLSAIHPMPNNPFQIRDDPAMNELIESVSQFGILVPVEVRPTEFGDYEMISGSRRQHACIAAGLDAVPAIILSLDDDDAIIRMVDSNIQRENILPSERAHAYKMRMLHHNLRKGDNIMSKTNIPQYGTTMRGNIQYYRTRIMDADGKQVALYAATPEELYRKERKARKEVAEIIYRNNNPTIEDYCKKWLLMKSATISASTLKNYTSAVNKYIIEPLGGMYLSEVTTDDLLLALAPVANMSERMYDQVNMLLKCIFASAEHNHLIDYNPATGVPASGGKPSQKKEVLTDEQIKVLLDTVRGLPPYVFIMIGLYSGLRREEILALQWDCVFLDEPTPYISVRRAWRTPHGKAEISTALKSKAAKRDIPIPKCLVTCLRDTKANSKSDFVIANSNGEPLSESQFRNLWNYVDTRTAKEKSYYRHVNGRPIKCTLDLALGSHPRSINFDVTPHQLRHTYITNLLYAGVDPKTVQYLAGHENSKTTMDIYAQIKYNQPEQLCAVVNAAFT